MVSIPLLGTAPIVGVARVVPPGAERLLALARDAGLEAQLFVTDAGDTVVEAWRLSLMGRMDMPPFALRIAWVGQRAQRGMLYDGNPYGLTTNVTTLTARLKGMTND